MPSSLSAALIRAISFPPHFRSPFLNPNYDPSHFIHRSASRSADSALRCLFSSINFTMNRRRSERNGVSRSASENWSAGICSSRSNLAEGEGKCVDGGKMEGRGRSVDSSVVLDQEGCKKMLREEGVSCSRVFTLPTVITLGRVAAVPVLVSTFHMDGSWATTTTTGIFLVAAFTDWLDGYLARKMQLGTTFGAFLDPVADKLMVATTLVLLCSKPLEVAFFGVVPWILSVPAIAIIGREITMSAVREWAASQNGRVLEAVAVNNLGKWKTATQMTALTILLLTRDPSLTGAGFLVSTGVLLLYVSAGLALWSLAVYMKKIWRFMIR